MQLIDFSLRSTPLQHINGGKDQFAVSYVYLHTPWLGHGNIGVEDKICNDFMNLFVLSMIIHACGLVVRELFMKVLRSVTLHLTISLNSKL